MLSFFMTIRECRYAYVVVVREPEPRRMRVVEALPPREPRRVHVNNAGTTIAVAVVGAVVGAVVSAIAR